jgi:hypothetical protein
MNTKKVVFAKLFSKESAKAQKLSKQRKISLSLVDEMQNYLGSIQDEVADGIVASDSAYELAQEVERQIESLSESLSYLEGYIKSYYSYNSQAADLLAKYRTAAEDLGISPEDNDTYNQLEEALVEMNDAYGQVEFSINALKQLIK